MAVRTASGAVLLGLLILALWLGQPFFDALVAILVGLGLWEYRRLWQGAGLSLDLLLLGGLTAFWLFRYAYPQVPQLAGPTAAVLAGLALGLRRDPKDQPWRCWAVAVGGAAWLGLCPSYLLLLYHSLPGGWTPVAVLLLTVGVGVIGDSLAYLVGSRFGRHPFMRRISPSKTWEGAVAAVVAPTIAMGLLLPLALPGLSRGWAFGIGLAAAVAAVLGDLVESQLKRGLGVKDSGGLIPGHGGVLDRVDSLIFVGAVVYSLLGVAHAF
ncbi:MAG: phosphatidate cytidylyltransferase [Candidatus Dormibacteria bacterium]